jgi:signal transduction histidine kinase
MGSAVVVANAPPVDEEKLHSVLDSLRQSQSQAVAGQFAAVIMHEINNPLEAVQNLNYLVRHNAGNEALVEQFSQLIEEQLASIVRIARQTLSYYKPAVAREKISIASVAEAALRVHQKSICAKDIRLVKNLSGDAVVEAHPGEMLQVLSNLIANAVEALPVHGSLHLRIKRSSRETRIVVADNGPGIPDSIAAHIFDPFFTTKRERGTGLGLAISKAIVEKHRGTIRSRSTTRPGRTGTAFCVSLPSTLTVN